MIWGSDYMMMDSSNFSGGTEYEKIIAMFVKIWDVQGPALVLMGNA